MEKFKGVYSAIFSIYDENMKVKKASIEKLMKYNLDNGLLGFYVGGGTGECTVLPNRVRKEMLETVKENAGKDVKIITHVGAGHFEDTMELVEHSNAVGVDAISSLPPALTAYYSPQETIEYYRILAEKSNSPVLAYVNPILKCDIMWFAEEIMKIDNILGMKMTIPDYFLFSNLRAKFGEKLNLLNGPDETLMAGLSFGADGGIGLTYNIMPMYAAGIYDCFQKRDWDGAMAIQMKMNRVIEALLGGNMARWKVAMELMGFDMGYTVAPAHLPTKEEKEEIAKKLAETDFGKTYMNL